MVKEKTANPPGIHKSSDYREITRYLAVGHATECLANQANLRPDLRDRKK